MLLHEFLASSGNTKELENRFEIWVHDPHDLDSCYPIELNLVNLAKYAGYEVIYFGPDYLSTDKRLWIIVGIRKRSGND